MAGEVRERKAGRDQSAPGQVPRMKGRGSGSNWGRRSPRREELGITHVNSRAGRATAARSHQVRWVGTMPAIPKLGRRVDAEVIRISVDY